MTFNPEECERLARELAEDDERATPPNWYPNSFWRAQDDATKPAHRWRIFLCGARNPSTNSRDCDWTEADARAIARLRNNARAASEQLRAACAEVDRLREKVAARLHGECTYDAHGFIVYEVEFRECFDCGAWLPLGPARDTPETAVEVRAARLAIEGDHNSLFLVEALMTDESSDNHDVIRLAATIAEHPTGADQ